MTRFFIFSVLPMMAYFIFFLYMEEKAPPWYVTLSLVVFGISQYYEGMQDGADIIRRLTKKV